MNTKLKLCIVTLCIGETAKEISKISHPLFQDYAKLVSAEFIIIDKPVINLSHLYFEKLQLFSLLGHFDRALYLDSDIILTPKCPNLFDIVPSESVGAFLEDNFLGKLDTTRRKEIELYQRLLGDIGWKHGYFNAGVILLSKIHREALNPKYMSSVLKVATSAYQDQSPINYRVRSLEYPVFDIGLKFNHMSWPQFDTKNSRFSSYIIHYAGCVYGTEDLKLKWMIYDDWILKLPFQVRVFVILADSFKLFIEKLLIYSKDWIIKVFKAIRKVS